jgi:hypothetical protein
VRHGGFAIDVPAGWADQSALLFVAPRIDGEARTLAPQTRPTETIAIRFAIGAEGDARTILEAQLPDLRVTDPDLQVTASGPFTSSLGAGWQQTQTIHVGGIALVQIATCTVIGPIAVLATATAAEARFPHVQTALQAALTSMRAVR